MYTNSPITPISTFVVRFWVKWSSDGQSWRGTIEHLQSGNRFTFQELEDVYDFIWKYLGISPGEETSEGRD